MAPRYSIVILACDKADYTEACLQSLLITRPADFEAVVVDNGSADRTPDMLRRMRGAFEGAGARLRVIRNEQNVGAPKGRNQAMEMAEGEYFAFLDNDCVIVDPAWLETLREALESHPNAAIAGPKMVYPFEPHWIQCAGVGVSRTGRVQFRGRGEPKDDPRFNRREEVQALISACFLFRRSLYEDIGGLDEAFNPVQFEDFDFCYRARERGGKCLYVPETEVAHWESVTSDGTAVLPNTYLIVKNGMKFKARWRKMFEKEDGPPDAECVWKVIEAPGLDGGVRRVGGR